ncbi:MAG: alpha-glucan family phosphorylase [Candidatus Acidiferrales bacterium]|jgi:starch phosphorylase
MVTEKSSSKIAYFSMEIALDPAMPTYGGGLGVLAGDMLRSAADLELPIVAVTLAHRKGYFRQHIDAEGNQTEEADPWTPETVLQPVQRKFTVQIEQRDVQVRAWRYNIHGLSGFIVPVYMLDTDLPENTEWDRTLTDTLYGGDQHYRICQEVLLGMGGVQLLRAVGLKNLSSYHMNEGHAAFLTLALLEETLKQRKYTVPVEADVEVVRRRCVFTTHTPVEAGHDRFGWDLVLQVLGEKQTELLKQSGFASASMLNMTDLAIHFSRYVNGVAMRHGEVSQHMFPHFPIHAITNGVHAATWASPPFHDLFDREIPEWRRDNAYMRYAVGIPLDEIRRAHCLAKTALFKEVQKRTGVLLDDGVLTIGFARRAATYKRADLLFRDIERLKAIAESAGPIQILYAGKAHPHDGGGKALIQRVIQAAAGLKDAIRILYLENYNMGLAKFITSGVDLWLNTPQRPQEASGTSGMKAALNGIPSLSVLDGWWVEGCVEGVTGWAIGYDSTISGDESAAESQSLYEKLEKQIIPMYYRAPESYAQIMRMCISLNASFFNTHRMLSQYKANAYSPRALIKNAQEM